MLHLVKEEIRALVVCVLILIVSVAFIFIGKYAHFFENPVEITEQDREIMRQLEQRIREDSIRTANRTILRRDSVVLFPFDPNHADSVTLTKLGLRSWQISNMMKYRRKGGKWRSKDDFSRLYGLSETDFKRLRPYIQIAAEDRSKKNFYKERQQAYEQRAESLHYNVIKKLPEGSTLELSLVDTTALKQIPGIGSYYAGKIVRYRERLGGFVSLNQLNDIDGLPPDITRWFTLDSVVKVCKIDVNHATFKELVRHPYISFEQTKVLVDYIRKFGPIESWQDLRLLPEFKEKDLERLAPYVVFK